MPGRKESTPTTPRCPQCGRVTHTFYNGVCYICNKQNTEEREEN